MLAEVRLPGVVLIVDDEADVRDAIAEIVVDEGFSAVCARDGVEALALIEGGCAPDLVLIDIMMPRMDGVTLAATLSARSSVRFVMLSAHEDVKKLALESGAAGHFYKPVTLDDLVAKLHALMSGAVPPPVSSSSSAP